MNLDSTALRDLFTLDPNHTPPPDWRWQLGGWFVRDPRRVPREWIDPWVRQAALLQSADLSQREKTTKPVLDKTPVARTALEIHKNSCSFLRWEVEARLLVGEASDVVAQKCNTQPDVVDAYHELFYCVRSALHVPTYVFACILPPKIHRRPSEDDTELLLKSLGYTLGSVFLDIMVDFYQNPPVVPAGLDGLDELARLRLTNKLWVRALILSRTLPLDRRFAKRAAILSKAVDVLGTHGLNDRTAAMICAALGVKHSTTEPAASDLQPVVSSCGQEPPFDAASYAGSVAAKVA